MVILSGIKRGFRVRGSVRARLWLNAESKILNLEPRTPNPFPRPTPAGTFLPRTMRRSIRLWVWVIAAGLAALAGRKLCAQVRMPFELLDEEPENVYLPPAPPTLDQMVNQGGVHFSLNTSYLSNYMYRGIDQSTPPKRNEKALQFDGKLSFDLGKLPHPFVGVFSNIFNNDPVSRFEEVRPYAGAEWTIRPITIAGGFNGYIFPNREGIDTQEIWTQISVDDSRFFHTKRPFLAPYVYGAYDFDKYDGFYLEGGIKHDFVIGDGGLVFTAVGDFAYVAHDRYFRVAGPLGQATGFQHYDAGLIATYDLDNLLGISRRYGQWELKGYLFYTGPVAEAALRASSRIWGGVGLEFRY